MEEGYLALRWNNHHAIFTKIMNLLREQDSYTDVSLACGGRLYPAHKFVLSTCSDYFKEIFSKTPCIHPVVFLKDVTDKDIESLLDFMYKGEVHVPQSELGSLLRTAEGLQIKGLAVPDDATRTKPMTASMNTPDFGINTRTPKKEKSFLSANHSLKRKRLATVPSEKKDDPPKLMPRPKGSVSKRLSKAKPRTSSMPELKRIKMEEKKILNSINNNLVVETDENQSATGTDASSPIDMSAQSEDASTTTLQTQFKMEVADDLPDEQNGELDRGSGDEDYGEVGQDQLAALKNELDDYDSLPNSDVATSELLQVDLSEDGTQFIIAPGVLGGEVSRGSSSGGDDTQEPPKKPFVCLLCGHTFTRRDNLANHLKTHTGDRPFMCQYCHKCFSRKDYLKQHERIHTGEKPYPCEICRRAFTRKEGLTDHMRCHSDFKEFSCDKCGKCFKQKCGLRFHKRNYKH